MGKKEKIKVEKRKHQRKQTSVQVEVVTGGQLHKEIARDVSFSGIYIKNSDFHKYEVNQDIVLAFESKDGEPYTIEGKVIRKDEKGTAIQFNEELVSIALKHAEEWKPPQNEE
ncbi:MAG: PilZ domain-containing protein [Pseudomonadota bacterium]